MRRSPPPPSKVFFSVLHLNLVLRAVVQVALALFLFYALLFPSVLKFVCNLVKVVIRAMGKRIQMLINYKRKIIAITLIK